MTIGLKLAKKRHFKKLNRQQTTTTTDRRTAHGLLIVGPELKVRIRQKCVQKLPFFKLNSYLNDINTSSSLLWFKTVHRIFFNNLLWLQVIGRRNLNLMLSKWLENKIKTVLTLLNISVHKILLFFMWLLFPRCSQGNPSFNQDVEGLYQGVRRCWRSWDIYQGA